MNEQQKNLMPYIEYMTSAIVAEKEEKYIAPAGASSVEILRNIHDDTVE